MSDIIYTIPWHCGDSDCSEGWHQRNYEIHHDGTYTLDNYASGDPEGVDEADLPTYEEAHKAEEEYRVHVHETGEDPLYQYRVKHSYKRKVRYTAEFRQSIGGAILCRWKRGRGAWSIGTQPAPKMLADYLDLTWWDFTNRKYVTGRRPVKEQTLREDGGWENHGYTLEEYAALAQDDLQVRAVTRMGRRNHTGNKSFAMVHLTIEEPVDRKPSAISRDLKRITGGAK